MRCMNCGTDVIDGTKFCPGCGGKIRSNDSQTIQLRCKGCGGIMAVNEDRTVLACPYCGSKELITESDTVTVERIKQKAFTEVEFGKQQLEREKMQYERDEANARKEETARKKFKKSAFSKVLIVFAIIGALMVAVSFNAGKVFAGIIAIVMTALFALSWLMGMQVIKEKKKGLRFIAAIIGFVLIIPYFSLYNSESPRDDAAYGEFSWSDIKMHDILPEPERAYGEISINTETTTILTLSEYTEDDFEAYTEACIEKGFTIDAEKTSGCYDAYNAEGYNVRLVYFSSAKEINIYLDAPRVMETFDWPTTGAGSYLPKANSTMGKITTNESETFSAYIGNTPIEEYNEYVKRCEDAGFNVDYSKDDDSYSAQNTAGFEISLKYVGYDTMEISIKAPADQSDGNDQGATTSTTAPTEGSTSGEGVTPAFKETMDSYEKFFDEYIVFMNEYSTSDDPYSLMDEYDAYMKQYAETMEKLNEIDGDELSPADHVYYIEVQRRIMQKLYEMDVPENDG